jgi:hypothetical protein
MNTSVITYDAATSPIAEVLHVPATFGGLGALVQDTAA